MKSPPPFEPSTTLIAAQAGSREARAALLEQYGGLVLQLCRRLSDEGRFEDWPVDVEARFLPEALRFGIEGHLDGRGSIVATDCDEYPCLHFVEYDPEQLPETSTDLLRELMDTMTSGRWEGAKVPNVFVADLEDDDGNRLLVGGIAVQTDEDLKNENLQQRLEQRGSRMLEDVLSARE